jgi:hypothetical protein
MLSDTMRWIRLATMVLAISLRGCTEGLPPGWEDAEPIEDFHQRECSGDPYGASHERVEAESTADAIGVDYLEAHFRCEQKVEGFFKTRGAHVEVLVQPVDMDPSAVAACDCLYDIRMTVPVEAPVSLTLFRRWDNQNEPNDPVEIGSVDVAPQ